MRKLLIFGLLLIGLMVQGQAIPGFNAGVVAGQGGGSSVPAPAILTNSDSTLIWLTDLSTNGTFQGDTVVTQWSEGSGNNNHPTQATSANMPHYDGDTLILENVDEYLSVTFGAAQSQPVLVYMIAKQETWSAAAVFITDPADANPRLIQRVSTPGIDTYDDGNRELLNNDMGLGEWHIVRWFANAPGTSKLQVDAGTASTTTTGGATFAGVSIGNASASADMKVIELIVMVTDYDEAAIYSYLSSKLPQ